MEAIALDLARAQFAVTTIFHMIWPLLSIGLSLMMVVMEILWLKTNNEIYYRQVRFWSAIFIMAFGIGVASGVPLELEFGTNWSRFSTVAGDIFGTILAFEAAMSFALEAAFLAIFFFGWAGYPKGFTCFPILWWPWERPYRPSGSCRPTPGCRPLRACRCRVGKW